MFVHPSNPPTAQPEIQELGSGLVFYFTFELILLGLMLHFAGCDLPTDPGPQPRTIISTEFKPALNVFGVLRLDDTTGTSIFRVERIFQIKEAKPEFSPVIPNAEVKVKGKNDTTEYIFSFVEDSLRGSIYTHNAFAPRLGETYYLTIIAPEFPTLTGETTIPPKPAIDPKTLYISTGSLSFHLLPNKESNLYDVYLIFPMDTLYQRIAPTDENPFLIRFNYEFLSDLPQLLEIYEYDTNLSEYLRAPVTVKPQVYLETTSTVHGGYGCFGSVARTRVVIE